MAISRRCSASTSASQREEVVSIIGANGAGKSTLLKTIAGLLRSPREGVRFAGEPIGGLRPGDIARRGIALVPEGRRLFASLSVQENLSIGAQRGRRGNWDLSRLSAVPYAREGARGRRLRSPADSRDGRVAARCGEPGADLLRRFRSAGPIVVKQNTRAPAIFGRGLTATSVENDVSLARHVSDRLTPAGGGADAVRTNPRFSRGGHLGAYFCAGGR